MMRDEEDIVRESVAHMAAQVDEVVVLDNRSRDATPDIVRSLGARVVDTPDRGFYQAQRLTELARMLRTEWVVPFDADEIWLTRRREPLSEVLARLPRQALVCEALVFTHVATGLDEPGPPVASIQHRRPEFERHRSVACRVRPDLEITPGLHTARYGGRVVLKADGLVEVRHFPARSPEQLIRKIRNGAEAYEATDLPHAENHRWRRQAELSDEELRELFRAFHFSEDASGLIRDPCPGPAASADAPG
jgi:glycosyltransferase involved in cell wall biosynthesis